MPYKDREKQLAYWRQYHHKHKEKKAAYQKEYRELNRERLAAQHADWMEKNKKKFLANCAKWKRDNPDKVNYYSAKRRAAKYGNGGSHTFEQKLAKWEEYEFRCFYCGTKDTITVDHQTPLSRGGGDEIGNIVPCCKPCNLKKGTKTLDEFCSHFLSMKAELAST